MVKLHDDIATLIRKGATVHKTAESVTLMKFDENGMTVERKATVLCAAEKLVKWEQEFDDVLKWYKKFSPTPSKKLKVEDNS